MKPSILYYPSIDIRSEQWLKSAILYWDKVCSIVPYEGYDGMSEQLEYLQMCKQYRAIYPMQLFTSDLAEAFAEEVEKRLQRKRRLKERQRRGCTYNDSSNMNDSDLYQTIYWNKIPKELFRDLERQGFVRINRTKEGLEEELNAFKSHWEQEW